MDIITALWLFIFWLIILTLWGDILLDWAVNIARKIWVSEAVIGLTIVAVGTSMPELVVSVLATSEWKTELAIWNILWTNIVNLFLILWVMAIVTPLVFTKAHKHIDFPMASLTAILLLIVVSDAFIEGASMNVLSRIDGIAFLFIALIYIYFSIKFDFLTGKPLGGEVEKILSPVKAWFWVFWWVVALYVWGKFLVDGAVELARIAWLSEAFIGLTIVAAWTSAPEMVTSIMAARKWKADIAVGNLIGSFILNILLILGVASIILPIPFLYTSYFDLFLNILTPCIILALTFLAPPRGVLGKKEWFILLGLYILYIAFTIMIHAK